MATTLPTFTEFIAALPDHEHQTLGCLRLPLEDCTGLKEELENVTLTTYFVSDDSVKDGKNGHSCKIKGNDHFHQVDGTGPCNRDRETIDSFRTGYLDQLAMAYFLWRQI